MGIYIKNMKKPTDCKYCVMYRNGYCGAKGGFCRKAKGVDDDCPIIEIPDNSEVAMTADGLKMVFTPIE